MDNLRHISTVPYMAKAATTKANTYRVYLGDQDAAHMAEICEATDLGQSELLSKLVIAGIRAVKENRNRLLLPLRFRIEMEEDQVKYRGTSLNEPPKALKR